MKIRLAAITLVLGLLAMPGLSAENGPAADVAPGAKDSIMQMWPRAAWSEGAKCWLVAWREGDITQEKSDIWCARVSADGKALDPKGIRLTSGKGVKDRPSVASDGKNFLVVWEDLRNGKDWDVYAARVAGDGKVLDTDGVVMASGAHNQCRPTAVFSKGGYRVIYAAFVSGGKSAGRPGTGYVIYDLPLSAEAKPAGAPGALSDPKLPRHVFQHYAAAGDGGVLVAAYQRLYGRDYDPPWLGTVWTATPGGKPSKLLGATGIGKRTLRTNSRAMTTGSRAQHQSPAIAWTGKGYLVGIASGEGRMRYAMQEAVAIYRLDAQGKDLNPKDAKTFTKDNMVYFDKGKRMKRNKLNPCVSLAFDGARCLLTQGVVVVKGRKTTAAARMQVQGYFLSPEGKPQGGLFLLAGDAEMKKDCMQGFAVAGPKGQFLVVWSEARGVDDIKIATRIVK